MNMENVRVALEVMGKGMGGIFVALGIIAVCVWIMQKIFKK